MLDKIQDKGEAFDTAIALYNWCSHWYDGMGCDKYAIMSKLIGKYNMCNIPDIDDMTQYHYDNLTEDNYTEISDNLFDYLDNDWDNED